MKILFQRQGCIATPVDSLIPMTRTTLTLEQECIARFEYINRREALEDYVQILRKREENYDQMTPGMIDTWNLLKYELENSKKYLWAHDISLAFPHKVMVKPSPITEKPKIGKLPLLPENRLCRGWIDHDNG